MRSVASAGNRQRPVVLVVACGAISSSNSFDETMCSPVRPLFIGSSGCSIW